MTNEKAQIRSVLEGVRDSTQYEAVRQVMDRALNIVERDYDDSGLVKAASTLLEEMAKVKRAQRVLMWLGPALALIATALMFLVLRNFILTI